MFKEGNILYFTPFYFKNGNTAKNKYFVVLKEFDNDSILASLPTSRDSIPHDEVIESGCIELPDINLNCFVIPPNEAVTECNKCFVFRTHIYGYQIDNYDLRIMNDIYQIEGSDFEFFGEMKTEIFTELINCVKDSRSVKRKFKKLLTS